LEALLSAGNYAKRSDHNTLKLFYVGIAVTSGKADKSFWLFQNRF